MANLYVKKIGTTNNGDFKDHKMIGTDYLFQRWESVTQVLDQYASDEYKFFLARPEFDADSNTIAWYTKEWKEDSAPVQIGKLDTEQAAQYRNIFASTLANYREVVGQLPHASDGYKILMRAIQDLDVPNYVDNFVFAVDDRVVCVAWGMSLLEKNRNRIDSIIMGVPKAPAKKYSIRFLAGEHGSLEGNTTLCKAKGYAITAGDVPSVKVEDGYEFAGWDVAPEDYVVDGDKTFTAQIKKHEIEEEKKEDPPKVGYTIHFMAGEHGTLSGEEILTKEEPYMITANDVPAVEPKEGYEFTGWDVDPINCEVSQDKVFTAQYKKKAPLPWWKRFWLWLVGILTAFWHWFLRSGWKWLLGLLLLILLAWLLSKCSGGRWSSLMPGCTRHHESVINDDDSTWIAGDDKVRQGRGGIYDPGNPYQEVPDPTGPGFGYEDLKPILPGQPNELKPIEGDPEIIPGNPSVIANRLNILMENEEKSILDLARAFKEQYPSDQYQVVYYDDVVKRMQIEIPSAEREEMKQKLPSQFSEYQIFVFDEALFEGVYVPNDPAVQNEQKWYLDAIEAFDAWDITRGDESITVAIVDNGFNLSHPEFKGKVVMPYNVWTHNDQITSQELDHGTHVAGIAIGNADNGKGISGIAPLCTFMPVQVADREGRMTTTSILDGVMYALYQGADVINISLGKQLAHLENLPESAQREMINTHFKEEERLWREVMRIAQKHNNATIVIAAGNDNVLAGIDAMQRPELFVVVSALDKANPLQKADFSNYGDYSTVSAPGVDIYSTFKNGYESMPGTSMAAPIVTGAIALMKSAKKDLNNQQIICTLHATGKQVRDNVGELIQIKKALEKVQSGSLDDCTPEPSTGDVQILLKWNNYNDLDLMCIDPFNDRVCFRQKTVPSGGQLEIDMNVHDHHSNQPIENIYWPTHGAPQGDYHVELLYYNQHEPQINETPYEIIVRYGGKEEVYEGTISYSGLRDPKSICTFKLGTGTTAPPHADEPDPNRTADRDRIRQELLRRQAELQRQLDSINRQLSQL